MATGNEQGSPGPQPGPAPVRIFTIVNFRLPDSDYRLELARRCPQIRMTFGLPEPPPGEMDAEYVRLRFGEGFRAVEIVEFVKLFRRLRRDRHRLDYVSLFSTKLFLLGPFVARLAGVRSLTTMTGFGRIFNDEGRGWGPVRPLFLALLGRAFRASDAVLFQNRRDMEKMVERFPAIGGKAHYVGSAVALDVDRTRRDFGAERLVVLLLARLLPSKGVTDFLAVANELHDEGFEFVLAGSPSADYTELAAEVAEADAKGVITYAGVRRGAEVDALYENAHIFLFPSYGEGMARVMLEAGMAGLCPVAYDINANLDLVGDGEGFLVPVGDRAALVDRLRALRSDRAMLAASAARYHQHVSQDFSVETYIERFVGVLEKTAPAGAGAGAGPGAGRHQVA